MTFALGVFDLFTYGVPGAMQLAVVSGIVDKVTRFGFQRDGSDAWRVVSAAAARAGNRPVPRVNVMLLLAGIELRDRELAAQIAQLRATGLMLRNAVVPALLAVLVAVGELIAGPHRLLASGLALLFAAAALGFAWHGQRLRFWAATKTYEIGYWLDTDQPATTGTP